MLTLPRAGITLALERWPLRRPFVISRAVLRESLVVVARRTVDGVVVHGEGEAHESDLDLARAALDSARLLDEPAEAELDADVLRLRLPAGGVRNAIDAMLWDLACKRSGRRAAAVAGLEAGCDAEPLQTMVTVTLDTPEAMARAAAERAGARTLKLKLGATQADGFVIDADIERVLAVHAAAPQAVLTVDPNEGWTLDGLQRFCAALRGLPIALIEQPLPAAAIDALADIRLPFPVAADESCTTLASLQALIGRVQIVNLKLDKSGGLTEALETARAARRLGMGVMVGCNTGTSLAMAAAFPVARLADFVDLDGPLHLACDREPAMRVDGSAIVTPDPALWG
jgi:L-alanine-DL-glutamate epimerase-like enolase superfamily enzyme